MTRRFKNFKSDCKFNAKVILCVKLGRNEQQGTTILDPSGFGNTTSIISQPRTTYMFPHTTRKY